MAITEVDRAVLASVRQIEALALRACLTERIDYDGTWVMRANPLLPVKELNAISFLDPFDDDKFDLRLSRLLQSKPTARLSLKVTPLTPSAILTWLKKQAWAIGSKHVVFIGETRKIDSETPTPFSENARTLPIINHLTADDYLQLIAKETKLADPVIKRLKETLARNSLEKIMVSAKSENGQQLYCLIIRDGTFAGLTGQLFSQYGGNPNDNFIAAILNEIAGQCNTVWLAVDARNISLSTYLRSIGFQPTYTSCYWSADGR